jgi:hypothetical protein
VAIQLAHQGLAKAHHLAVALALGVEVAAALAAAHGQRGQRVLEGLLEAQELQDRQVDAGVKAHAALVGADGHVVLHAEGPVDLGLALVVHPRHAELDGALGLDQALQQAVVAVLGMRVQKGPQRDHHLAHGLQELGLVGVAALDGAHEIFKALGRHRKFLLKQEWGGTAACGAGRAAWPRARPPAGVAAARWEGVVLPAP